MINKAIEKITKEMMSIDTPFAIAIEEHLTGICKTQAVAEKILNPEKSLKGACKYIKDKAHKQVKGSGVAVISDQDGYRMAEEYFDIEKTASKKIDIMDLL